MPGRPWTRDETLIAFALYCKLPFGRLHARNPEIIRVATGIDRTAASVAMKCVNLASLDEHHSRRGVRGLSNASKLDQEVWRAYQSDPEQVSYDASVSLAQLGSNPCSPHEAHNFMPDEGLDQERLVRVRINQRFFRELILASYSSRCAVCGLGLAQLVVASHIVPWAIDPANRMNPRNGLCLCGTHDLAFERGVFLITRDSEIRVAGGLAAHRGTKPADDWLFQFHGRHLEKPDRWPPDPELLARREALAGAG